MRLVSSDENDDRATYGGMVLQDVREVFEEVVAEDLFLDVVGVDHGAEESRDFLGFRRKINRLAVVEHLHVLRKRYVLGREEDTVMLKPCPTSIDRRNRRDGRTHLQAVPFFCVVVLLSLPPFEFFVFRAAANVGQG